MNVEIINVGTELLLGEIVNTNATVLQKMCKELGFNVFYQSVVGDNPDRFKQSLQIAFGRGADCVITTGGLGPTKDDLTKELSAEFLGLEMVYLQEEAIKVEEKCKFVTGLDVIPENNFKQAYFPKNSFVLENEVGTANGCVMENNHRIIVNLPGPPKELNYVLEHELIPYLMKYKQDTIYSMDIITMGMGESKMEQVLQDLIDSQNEITIATYASEEVVRVRLACKAGSKKEANKKMESMKETIEFRCKQYILNDNDLNKTLSKLLPTYQVIYQSNFRFRETFLNRSSLDGQLKIFVDCIPHKLGEILKIKFSYMEKLHEFQLGLLKKAEYSYAKLEAKIMNQLILFLRNGK